MGPAVTIAALGFAVALAGDACHVAAGAVLLAAWSGRRAGLPAMRADVVTGAALVLALYALTAVVDGEPATVSVVLCGAVACAIWSWWDPSVGALFGVAPWLPCLYFGAGAVASGLWAAVGG